MRQPQRRGQRLRPQRRQQLKLLVLLLMSTQSLKVVSKAIHTGLNSSMTTQSRVNRSRMAMQSSLNRSSVIMQTILKRQLRMTRSLARQNPRMKRCNHLRHHRSIMASMLTTSVTSTATRVNPAPPKRIRRRRAALVCILGASGRREKPDYGKLFDKFITGPASRSTTSESGSQASHGPNKAPKFTA